MPSKGKKKASKNGYWQFAMELRSKQPNKFHNNEELQAAASQKWANMTREERARYQACADLEKNDHKAGRLTTDGLQIEVLEEKEKEAQLKIHEMKNDINTYLKTLKSCGTIDEEIFLIIHINHLIYHPRSDKFYICELAIAAFSLKNGIEDIFHRTIKPAKLPLGFYGDALAHSKETHQMFEVVYEDPYEDTTPEVLHDLLIFLKKYKKPNRKLILYCDEKTMDMTKKVFENFMVEYNFSENVTIYLLQFMFFTLRNVTAGRIVWPTDTSSYSEISRDVYAYTSDISCEYHEFTDIPVYCSKSIVTRYCYTICDNCCADMNISLVPGYHVPKNAKIFAEYPKSISSNAPSICSNDEFQSVKGRRGYASCNDSSDENYRPSGSTSTPSMISFSSMRTSRNVAPASYSGSVSSISLGSQRNHKNLNFPEHGFKKQH